MKKFLLFAAVLTLAALPLLSATGGGTVTVAADIVATGFSAPATAIPVATTPVFTDGSHLIKYAYVTSTGVSYLSAAGTTRTTDAAHTNITVSVVASARTEVVSVNIYATKAGATTPYYLAKTGVANSTADVPVGALDAALTSLAPTADTASAAGNTSVPASSGKYFRSLWVHNLDGTNAVYITLDGTDPVTSVTVGSWSIAANGTWGPIELPSPGDGLNCSTIKMRFLTGGGVVQYWYREDM